VLSIDKTSALTIYEEKSIRKSYVGNQQEVSL